MEIDRKQTRRTEGAQRGTRCNKMLRRGVTCKHKDPGAGHESKAGEDEGPR